MMTGSAVLRPVDRVRGLIDVAPTWQGEAQYGAHRLLPTASDAG
jgi:hypothetical protein